MFTSVSTAQKYIKPIDEKYIESKEIDENGKEIERIDEGRTFNEAHPGAVYYFEGDSFIVKDLDLRNKEIFLTKKDVDYYTQSLEINSTKIIKFLENKKRNDLNIFYGDLKLHLRLLDIKKENPSQMI